MLGLPRKALEGSSEHRQSQASDLDTADPYIAGFLAGLAAGHGPGVFPSSEVILWSQPYTRSAPLTLSDTLQNPTFSWHEDLHEDYYRGSSADIPLSHQQQYGSATQPVFSSDAAGPLPMVLDISSNDSYGTHSTAAAWDSWAGYGPAASPSNTQRAARATTPDLHFTAEPLTSHLHVPPAHHQQVHLTSYDSTEIGAYHESEAVGLNRNNLDAGHALGPKASANVLPRTTPDALHSLLESVVPKAVRRSRNQESHETMAVRLRGLGGASEIVYRLHGNKRYRFDESARLATALTRKLGACSACKRKKLRCNQPSGSTYASCERCVGLAPSLLIEPCCRVEIIDVKLFRLGTLQPAVRCGSRLTFVPGSTTNPSLLEQWTDSKESGKGLVFLDDGTTILEAPRRLTLTQDINTVCLSVTVSRFQPVMGDVTGFPCTDAWTGVVTTYELPPYYISDMAEAAANLRKYIREARREYCNRVLAKANPIVRKTFREAERYRSASKTAQSELLATALLFWSATRMIERTWLICGDDLLDLDPMKESIGPCKRNPFVAAIPATPRMDTQLDQLAIGGILIPLGRRLLGMLKQKALGKKRADWYEIYLASFIILNNTERVLHDVVDFTQGCGMTSMPRSNSGSSLSHAYFHACKTILVYFHFACGGAAPLHSDWLEHTRSDARLDQDQLAYLREVRSEMLSQGKFRTPWRRQLCG
ncbi:hypothetical protein LTR53_000336 [Teratosphaeriaceae sp. CCFEE 6253]|nr:hypothetical protein LTR53_000336 [Teratosphaeriaceae sp. CCFEE 6253]